MLLYCRNPWPPRDVGLLKPTDVSASIRDHRARIIQHIEEVQRLAKINIQRAQQRMKDYYERDATSTWYAVVYTPKTKRGLSRKLLFSWHGPYTIVAQTSPVNYVLRVADNRRISTTVHVSHMKPYVDPASRPIRCSPEDVDDSFLLEPTWEPLEIILDPSLLPGPPQCEEYRSSRHFFRWTDFSWHTCDCRLFSLLPANSSCYNSFSSWTNFTSS